MRFCSPCRAVVVLSCVGCIGLGLSAAAAPAVTDVALGDQSEGLHAGRDDVRPRPKGLSTMRVDARVSSAEQAGASGVVTLVVAAAQHLTNLSVILGRVDSIAYTGRAEALSISALPAGETIEIQLPVVLLESGRFGLPITVRANAPSGGSVVSIVVPVGQAVLTADGLGPQNALLEAGGSEGGAVQSDRAVQEQGVHSLAAEESVR